MSIVIILFFVQLFASKQKSGPCRIDGMSNLISAEGQIFMKIKRCTISQGTTFSHSTRPKFSYSIWICCNVCWRRHLCEFLVCKYDQDVIGICEHLNILQLYESKFYFISLFSDVYLLYFICDLYKSYLLFDVVHFNKKKITN